jgi:hypothetical protein
MQQRLKQQVAPCWQLMGAERREKLRYCVALDEDAIRDLSGGRSPRPVDVQAAHRLR